MTEPEFSTPECDKMQEVREKFHTEDIGEFLEETEYVLAEWITHGVTSNGKRFEYYEPKLVPVYKSIDTILLEHYGIDINKVEAERRELIKRLRG